MSEEVIELSVDETNKLRAQLGLAPLRGTTQVLASSATSTEGSNRETLELSVEDTNDLRAKLGLNPLRVTSDAIHKPAENTGEAKLREERLEKETLKQQVQNGIASKFGSTTLGDKSKGDTMSWVQKMRAAADDKTAKKKKKKQPKGVTQHYDQEDLTGLNVSHAASDFEAGTTTVLTLADTSLLKTETSSTSKIVGLNDDEDQHLENVELADRQIQRDRLREKRQVEMGMGRAGGYAGYDDDEFEELGGVQGPSRFARGAGIPEEDRNKSRRGFRIGGTQQHEDQNGDNGLFSFQSGKAISLEQFGESVVASDFLTAEEDAALKSKRTGKDTKFKKKNKKKERKNKRKIDVEDDDDQDNEEKPLTGNILEVLEQTAVSLTTKRKRRSEGDDDTHHSQDLAIEKAHATERRARYDDIMEKANQQTAAVFKPLQLQDANKSVDDIDEEPDDSFLNEALAKARRIRKLRELSRKSQVTQADAVVLALQESKQHILTPASDETLTFAVDETREFTRALLARHDQEERMEAKKKAKTQHVKKHAAEPNQDTLMEELEDDGKTEDIEELAKQIKDDSVDIGIDGTANSGPIGRGMAGVLSMLRHTGEISGRNAGREEMRGRAKDERTYEDYAPLNLSEVVRIGDGATEKDKELASREIKLDYRDEHGRLLTRKEAYRNLCYQFHGHGSSAKNEERRLRQIERERAEARLASRQAAGAGSLGALKVTQKATGKAFVIHKT